MFERFRRAGALGALILGLTASFAAAAVTLPCADYLTSGINNQPMSGFLVGTSTRTVTVGGEIGAGRWGVGAGVERTVTETYEVGYYEFDGKVWAFDCRTYTLI